jgi:hypothetical protein
MRELRELRYVPAETHMPRFHPFAIGDPCQEGASTMRPRQRAASLRGVVRVFDLRPQNRLPVKASFWFHP